MTNGLKKKQEGFTIIEVVLVLAIAGLIFLIVFLALPQLQQSRRDTQRRNDAGRVVATMETYAGNNNGQYPSSNADRTDLEDNYLFNDIFDDPQTGQYSIEWGEANPDIGEMGIIVGEDCEGTAAARNIAVSVGLEEGSYCQDNR